MCFVILSANRCIWIRRFLLETSPLIPRGRSFVRAGAHRILFGSDCPWHSSAMDAEFIRSLGLSEQEEEQIFYQNACALLGREQI